MELVGGQVDEELGPEAFGPSVLSGVVALFILVFLACQGLTHPVAY